MLVLPFHCFQNILNTLNINYLLVSFFAFSDDFPIILQQLAQLNKILDR